MSFFKDKSIAIIGGSGTLGKACVKAFAGLEVKKVLIFSRDEIKQLEMMDEFPKGNYPFLEYKLGDVRDVERLTESLDGFDYVIHAAAIKHVVMAENNPGECWKTNVQGTRNVIESCKKTDIKRCILISTDKAINPIGVYGRSKADAEKLFSEEPSGKTSFGIVRFGNIIGARGSVFEAFERQRKTGVIKVTHPEATRFCISQENAALFTIELLKLETSEPMIPQMDTFRVIDLAKEIAPECDIEIVGLRAGDKLHEEVNEVSSSKFLQHQNLSRDQSMTIKLT